MKAEKGKRRKSDALLSYNDENTGHQTLTGKKSYGLHVLKTVDIPDSGRDGKWMRPLSPDTEPTYYPCSFSPPTSTPSQCTQLPLHRCRVSTALYTIEPKRKRGTTAIAYFFYRLAAKCSVQCARKYRQLRNLSVVLIIFAKKKKRTKNGRSIQVALRVSIPLLHV